MADEPKTDTTDNQDVSTEETKFSQAELEKIVQDRLAREKKKYADYDNIKTRLASLEIEKKEREDSELSESQKLAREIEKLKAEKHELETHKKWRDEWEARETEKINEAMNEFEDEDKELVNALPLDKRMAMINKLKSQKIQGSPLGDKAVFMDKERVPTLDEAFELKRKYGAGSKQYKGALDTREKARLKGII